MNKYFDPARMSEHLFSMMLNNVHDCLKENDCEVLLCAISPEVLVQRLKDSVFTNADELVNAVAEGADHEGLAKDVYERLFAVQYTFPNLAAMKTINSVVDNSKRVIPIMTSDATLEGEGPEIGRPTLLTRIGGCAVRCLGCDTPHSWNPQILEPFDSNIDPTRTEYNQLMDVAQVSQMIKAQAEHYGLTRISITGGEPLHYVDALRLLVADLYLAGFTINLETSGVLFDPIIFAMCHVSLDIKTPSSRVELMPYQIGATRAMLSKSNPGATHVKAVIANRQDLDFVLVNFERALKSPDQDRGICLTPWAYHKQEDINPGEMSTNVNDITKWVFENKGIIDSRQVRIIGQQHKLLSFT